MIFPFHDDNPTTRKPFITYSLIAINVVCFLLLINSPPLDRCLTEVRRGFVPARVGALVEHKPVEVVVPQILVDKRLGRQFVVPHKLPLPPDTKQVAFSLIACLFLHATWTHLVGNMWFLFIFGNKVEDRLGHLPFLFFYLVGGFLATASHWAYNPASTVPIIGASGAVSAVLGAYTIAWPRARVHTLLFLVVFITIVELPALLVLGTWFVVQTVEAFSVRPDALVGVAWWAHVGGFIAGMILMPIMCAIVGPDDQKYRAPEPDENDDSTESGQ